MSDGSGQMIFLSQKCAQFFRVVATWGIMFDPVCLKARVTIIKNKTSFVFQQGVFSKRLTQLFGNEISFWLGSTKDEKYQKTSFKISLCKVFPLVIWTSDWFFELCKYHLQQVFFLKGLVISECNKFSKKTKEKLDEFLP